MDGPSIHRAGESDRRYMYRGDIRSGLLPRYGSATLVTNSSTTPLRASGLSSLYGTIRPLVSLLSFMGYPIDLVSELAGAFECNNSAFIQYHLFSSGWVSAFSGVGS
jgi:hypothetical protein